MQPKQKFNQNWMDGKTLVENPRASWSVTEGNARVMSALAPIKGLELLPSFPYGCVKYILKGFGKILACKVQLQATQNVFTW